MDTLQLSRQRGRNIQAWESKVYDFFNPGSKQEARDWRALSSANWKRNLINGKVVLSEESNNLLRKKLIANDQEALRKRIGEVRKQAKAIFNNKKNKSAQFKEDYTAATRARKVKPDQDLQNIVNDINWLNSAELYRRALEKFLLATIFQALYRAVEPGRLLTLISHLNGLTGENLAVGRGVLKKATVNPNQDLEKLQGCSDDFINQELRKLTEIENGRPLKPNEEEREGILLYKSMSRRFHATFNTTEAKDEAAKLEQYAGNFRKKVTETPSPFKESQWVRIKTSTLQGIPDGSEGVILDVLSPDFDLYIEEDIVRYKYLLEVHAEDSETFQIIGSAAWTVDEDQLEATAV